MLKDVIFVRYDEQEKAGVFKLVFADFEYLVLAPVPKVMVEDRNKETEQC